MAVLKRIVLCLLVALMGGCRSGPEQWGPFRGQVIDAETGMPIAGAHVMVPWIREPPSLHYSQWFYDAQETTTGADGRFELPRQTRFLTAWVIEPGISVFAPDYQMQTPEVTPADGRRYVDPTVVRMHPLMTREERCKRLWTGPPINIRGTAPTFMEALQEYNVRLKCSELLGGR